MNRPEHTIMPASASLTNLAEALLAVQKELKIGHIDVFNKHGLAVIQRNHPIEGHVGVETILIHKSGECISTGILAAPLIATTSLEEIRLAIETVRLTSLSSLMTSTPASATITSSEKPSTDVIPSVPVEQKGAAAPTLTIVPPQPTQQENESETNVFPEHRPELEKLTLMIQKVATITSEMSLNALRANAVNFFPLTGSTSLAKLHKVIDQRIHDLTVKTGT